jgi:hypothetical protein
MTATAEDTDPWIVFPSQPPAGQCGFVYLISQDNQLAKQKVYFRRQTGVAVMVQ